MMARDHHDFAKDKDTPENIRQLLEQDSDSAPRNQQGLPARNRLDEEQDLEELFTQADEDPNQAAIDIHFYGGGGNRAFPNEFHSKKGNR